MLLSHRPSVLKLASIVFFIALVLIFFLPSYTWPITTEKSIPIPDTPSRIPTYASKTISSETALPETTVLPETTEPPENTAIPEKLWYKLGPRAVSQQTQEWIDSCLNQNPTYKSEFLTDLSGDAYVKDHFAHRPDIVEAFLALQFPILKADFLRLMLLYNEGGVYLDLDVSCDGIPMRNWIPAQYRNNASLVVGWEFDVGWGDNFVREFATWTIMARPGSPHLSMVLDDIVEGLREKTTKYNVTIAELTLAMVGDVVDLTGPRRMTRGILKSLKATLGGNFDEKSIALLYEPMLVADVLIMPGYSFSLSSNHYKPEDTQGPVLVTHHFNGSWKNDHYGETVDPIP